MVSEEDVTRARAQQVDAAYVVMDDVVVDKGVLPLVSAAVAHKYLLLPVGKTPDGTLKVVVAAWNARVMEVAHKIATAHRLRLLPALATRSDRCGLSSSSGTAPPQAGRHRAKPAPSPPQVVTQRRTGPHSRRPGSCCSCARFAADPARKAGLGSVQCGAADGLQPHRAALGSPTSWSRWAWTSRS